MNRPKKLDLKNLISWGGSKNPAFFYFTGNFTGNFVEFSCKLKSPPGRILSYFSAKTGSLTGSGCIFEYWCEFHLDEKETLL